MTAEERAEKGMDDNEREAIFRESVLSRMADEIRHNGALDPELMKDLIVRAVRIRCLREAVTQLGALRDAQRMISLEDVRKAIWDELWPEYEYLTDGGLALEQLICDIEARLNHTYQGGQRA